MVQVPFKPPLGSQRTESFRDDLWCKSYLHRAGVGVLHPPTIFETHARRVNVERVFFSKTAVESFLLCAFINYHHRARCKYSLFTLEFIDTTEVARATCGRRGSRGAKANKVILGKDYVICCQKFSAQRQFGIALNSFVEMPFCLFIIFF